jgi:hypothetical protein
MSTVLAYSSRRDSLLHSFKRPSIQTSVMMIAYVIHRSIVFDNLAGC